MVRRDGTIRVEPCDSRVILERTHAEFTSHSCGQQRGSGALNPFARVPYTIAAYLAAAAAQVAPRGTGKLSRTFASRRGAATRIANWARAKRDSSRPLIWFHAPSVGEGLMARPVIELLRARRPDAQFAYTFFSPSAESFAQALAVDVADYLPFDSPAAARALLDALQPATLVFSKLDVWPILAGEAAARRLPTALTSATLAANSGRSSAVARWLLKDAYASLSAVGAVHSDDAARLVSLGVRRDRVSVTGDVRYDQVWNQIAAGAKHADLLARLHSSRPTLVAGSTWPSDEVGLFGAWTDVRQRAAGARLIIAAHEPSGSHTARVNLWARDAGLRVDLLGQATAESDVVIVDRVGVLSELYAVADVAFVGGGFHDKGLHSVVEPAAYGKPVLFGPRTGSSRDAQALVSTGGGFEVRDSGALTERLSGLFTNADVRAQASLRAKQVVVDGLGAAERSAALVERLLEPTTIR